MRRPRLRHLALPLLLAAGTLRCGDTGGGEPPTATRIEMVDGNDQTAVVGQPLPDPLVVLVTDQNGDPVEGVGVSWAAQGGGTVSTSSVETNSDGRASVTRVLVPEPGEQTTTATVSGLEGSPVTFAATATDTGGGPGEAIAITTNPPVGAVDGEVFDPEAQPVLFVTNAGNPVAGVEVTATALSGTLEGTITATTDANGSARFLDLGLRGIGSHALEFTAGEAMNAGGSPAAPAGDDLISGCIVEDCLAEISTQLELTASDMREIDEAFATIDIKGAPLSEALESQIDR